MTLSVVLFVLMIHMVVLPTLKTQMLDRKREMIRELTNSAWGVLNTYEQKARSGDMSRKAAQQAAAGVVRDMRYGPGGKDYFWINDMQPRMIVHPYRPDLEGTDLSDYKDPNGKRLFVEFVRTVKTSGAGYVDYMWQWKDDPDQIVPKISYVREFKPWGWIVGTGIYVEDVNAEISRITKMLVYIYLAILAAMLGLSAAVVRNSLAREHRRALAEEKLEASMTLYSTLVEKVHDMVFMLDAEGRVIFINSYVCYHYNVKPEEVKGTHICFFWCGESIEAVEWAVSGVQRTGMEYSLDCACENRYYFLSIVPLTNDRGRLDGMICMARDITARKLAEKGFRENAEQLSALSQRVLSVQEEERARISRELHDELGQQLTALRWIIDLVQDIDMKGKDREAVDSLADVVDKATTELKRICRGLRPPFLDDLGLNVSMKALVDECNEKGSMNITFISIDIDDNVLPTGAGIIVYRTLQESLTNIMRHAQAKNAVVSLKIQKDKLILMVRDDGVGFSVTDQRPGQGLGLVGMKERAALCGGEITIDSKPQQGTSIRLLIPLKHSNVEKIT